MKNSIEKKTIVAALFGALVSASCFIQIPLPGGIPIVLQDMMAMLSGLILGPIYGGISVLLFLLLGSLGLPVFSGKGGFDKIVNGPTGGFLIGYFVAAVIGGLIVQIFVKSSRKTIVREDGSAEIVPAEKKQIILNWIFITLAALIATVICFVLGYLGFHRIKPDLSPAKTLAAVVIPFIPGNTIKLVLMILITNKIRPLVKNYMG